jgi:hypothetical protein
MKTQFVILVGIALFAVIGAQGRASDLSLSGVVTDGKNRSPVPQANVSVVGGMAVRDDVTDVDGVFLLPLAKDVKAGDAIRLRVRKSGYKTYDEYVSVPAEGRLAKPISLQPDPHPPGSTPGVNLPDRSSEFATSIFMCEFESDSFWAMDSSPTVFPIDILLVFQIVSLEKTRYTQISSFDLKMKTSHGWMVLKNVPVNSATGVMNMRLLWGPLQSAMSIEPENDLFSSLFRKQIGPGETLLVGGFFEYANPSYVDTSKHSPATFRIHLTDSVGRVTAQDRPCGNGSMGWWGFKTVPGHEQDISALPRKRMP